MIEDISETIEKERVRGAKYAHFNVGKGTNFFRNLKSGSCVGVGWEVCGSWVGLVKELGETLTFVSFYLLTFCNISGNNF